MLLRILVISALLCLVLGSCKKEKTETPETTAAGSDTTQTNTPLEPVQVYIYSVTASPTDDECITLKNNSGASADISAWTLGDENNSTAYNIPANTVLAQGELKTFVRTTLGFQINDSGETIYLKNNSGTTIDTWSN